MQKLIKGKIREVVSKELYHGKTLRVTGGFGSAAVTTPVINFFDDASAGDLYTNIKQARVLSNEEFYIRDLQMLIQAVSFNISGELSDSGDFSFGPGMGSANVDYTLTGAHPAWSQALHEFYADIANAIYNTSIYKVQTNQTEFLQCPLWRLSVPNNLSPLANHQSKVQEGGLILQEDIEVKPNETMTMQVQINQSVLQAAINLAFLKFVEANGFGIVWYDPPVMYPVPAKPTSILSNVSFELEIQLVHNLRGLVARSLR